MFWCVAILFFLCVLCSWLGPGGSSLERHAARAFESSVRLLSEEVPPPYARTALSPRGPEPKSSALTFGAATVSQPRTSAKRKRITPFQAKRVAARQHWRCAMCHELLTEDYEIDHVIPLHRGGSFDNDLNSLQAIHKRCHLLKNSIEQRKTRW